MKADVNLIDFDNLDVTYPSIAHDLPAGGKRVVQKSKGYFKTFVSGIEVYNEFGFTENFPGRLIKGNQKVNYFCVAFSFLILKLRKWMVAKKTKTK